MKTSKDIHTKAEAMKMKLKMFGIVQMRLTAYYGDVVGSVVLYDKDKNVWYVSSLYGTLMPFVMKTAKEKQWLNNLSKRKIAAINARIETRFNVQLHTSIDYAMCFDWLKKLSAVHGELMLIRMTTLSQSDVSTLRGFFLPTDTPELISIEWDLMNGDNVEK